MTGPNNSGLYVVLDQDGRVVGGHSENRLARARAAFTPGARIVWRKTTFQDVATEILFRDGVCTCQQISRDPASCRLHGERFQ